MKSLFIGLLALGSLSAFSSRFGLPNQDPIVSKLRSEFIEGRVPKGTDILNKKFHCRSFVACKDDYTQTEYDLKFTAFDGLFIVNSFGMKIDNKAFMISGKNLTTKGTGYVKSNSNQEWISTFRYNESGQNLIEEFSGTVHNKDRDDLCLVVPDGNYYYGNTRVLNYASCVEVKLK